MKKILYNSILLRLVDTFLFMYMHLALGTLILYSINTIENSVVMCFVVTLMLLFSVEITKKWN